MNFKKPFLFFFLPAVVLYISSIQRLNGQDMLVGVVSNKLVTISSINGSLSELANLSPTLQPQIRGITYHKGKCLLYGIIDELNTPKLVSISLNGTTNLIGSITFPGNMVTIVESISYNEADNQVYLSARINQPAGPGTYFSASILQINVDNALCSLVGNVNTSNVSPDIDAMTHYNGSFVTLDASSAPAGTWARFYRFLPGLIGSGANIPEIHTVNDFQTTTDLTVYQDEIYFTSNRMLFKGDPDSFSPVLIGQMHTATDYGGTLLQAIATVTPGSTPAITLGPDLELCTGETATLEIPEIEGASIVWSNGNTGPSTNVNTSGTYWVQVTQGACGSVTDTIIVNFNEAPDPVSLGPDLELCDGETATLQIPQVAGASILWSNGDNGPSITVNTPGTYWVALTQGVCDPVTDTVVVNFNEAPDPVSLGPDLELCDGETATLQVPQAAGASIVWSTGDTGPSTTVNTSGTYWVQVTQGACGSVTDTIVVNFTSCPDPDTGCSIKYYIPNVFSPNDDGINDKFEVYINSESCILESIKMQIFDRWGELVYEGASLSGWDGVFRTKKALTGVYVYVINMVFLNDAVPRTVFEKGDVTLIR